MTSSSKPPKAVSDYMAKLGARGGAVTGKAKRRGSAKFYRELARARWGDKAKGS